MSHPLRFMSAVLLCALSSQGFAADPPITCVRFAPDGRSIVACSQAGISVYAWPELNERTQFQSSILNLHDLAFSPDGDRLAVAGGTPTDEGTVEILSWPDGRTIQKLDGHLDSVMAVCWIDATTIASAGMDHDVFLWNARTGQRLSKLRGHSRGVTALASLGGHGILVSAGIDQSLRVWESETGRLVRSLAIHVHPVSSLAVRPSDGGLPMIASASDDATVRFWQPTIGRMVRFARLPSRPREIQWLADGTMVVACCDDGHAYLVDPDTVDVTDVGAAGSDWAYTIAVHPTDSVAVVGAADGKLTRMKLP